MWVTWGVHPGGGGTSLALQRGWTRAELERGGLRGCFSPLGLYPSGDLWPAQPVCVTSGFNCALENSVLQAPAPGQSRYDLTLMVALGPEGCTGNWSRARHCPDNLWAQASVSSDDLCLCLCLWGSICDVLEITGMEGNK